jgi:large subunit ribosomal protein L23
MIRLDFKGPQTFLPSMFFILLRTNVQAQKSSAPFRSRVAHFRVPVKMHKYDIQQYLENLYGVTVKRICIFNFLGRTSRKGVKLIKKPDWKKAIVCMNEPYLWPKQDA